MKLSGCIAFLLTLSYLSNSFGQAEINELHEDLSQTNVLKNKIEIYRKLGAAFYDVNLDSVTYYSRKTIQFGLLLNDSLIYSDGLHQLGIAERKKGNVDSSLSLLFLAFRLRENSFDKERISSSNLELGNTNIKKGAYLEGIGKGQQAEAFYEKSKKNYLIALNYALESKDSLSISLAYLNLGSAYDRLYVYEKAIVNYELANSWCTANRRKEFLSETEMKILSAKFELGLLDAYAFQAKYEILAKKFRAENKLDYLTYSKINFAAMMWTTNIGIAEKYLIEADTLAEEFGNLNYQIIANQYLSDLNKERGNFDKALHYYEVYNNLTNQVLNENSQVKLKELELKYNNEKFQKELKQEELTSAKQRVEKQKLSYTLYGTVIFLVLIIVFFIQRQRISALKRKETEEKYYRQINHLIVSQEYASVEAMLNGQEKERQRIAEDLHDRLGSTLSAAKMYFEYVTEFTKEIERSKAEKALNLLDQAIGETHEIANDLVAGVLSKFGIVGALKDFKNTIEGAGKVEVDLLFDDQIDRFHSDIEINLYRIIQEAVSNSLKHAQAKFLRIVFRRDGNQFIVLISDDGKGFDTNTIARGMGLKNIKARVAKLNGELSLNSNAQGTRLQLRFNI